MTVTSQSRTMGATVSTDIIDLLPLIRRKRQLVCPHQHTEVGDEGDASLTCSDCDAKLDPWWYIRRLADWESKLKERHQEYTAACDTKMKETNEIIERQNETITRLNAEISRLTDVKNQLSNERVGDRLLGHAAARPRRPRKR